MHDSWGERRILLLDEEGQVHSLAVSWTDAAEPDVFVTMAAGRSAFRVADLLELATMVEHLRASLRRV
jgi:hypothetical protein